MATHTWEPWNKFRPTEDRLPIPEPPCKECALWRPVRVFDTAGYAGVRLCHADDMCSDFSCWRPKETA